jgi:hypothetical protein
MNDLGAMSRHGRTTPRLTKIGAGLLALLFSSFGAVAQSAAPTPAPDNASEDNATALAKKLQNPIGDLYSFPFQNNTNFNTGPHQGTQDILNVQPVIPIHITEDWNIITRTILPLIWQPSLQPAQTVPFGTGPTTFSAFLSPSKPVDGWLWGIGPVVQVPTISSSTLGSNVWGGGPTGVLVYMKGPWVAGVLANNVWSFGGTPGLGGTRYNTFLTQPFVNYNFGEGWYVGTSPIITANWLTTGDHAWTLPVGANCVRAIHAPPILIGVRRDQSRALRLTAQYADYWNTTSGSGSHPGSGMTGHRCQPESTDYTWWRGS